MINSGDLKEWFLNSQTLAQFKSLVHDVTKTTMNNNINMPLGFCGDSDIVV